MRNGHLASIVGFVRARVFGEADRFLASTATLLCIVMAWCAPLRAAEQPVTLGLEAEDFQYQGSWTVALGHAGFSGRGFLFAGPSGALLPAAAVIEVPRTGRYFLWVRALDFPSYLPGTRRLAVSVQGERSKKIFGDSGEEGWAWEPGGAFELSAGQVLLGVHDVSKNYGRVDALLLTTDESLKPRGKLGTGALRRIHPVDREAAGVATPLAARPVQSDGSPALAALENEFVRYAFVSATSEGGKTIIPRVEVRHGDDWVEADSDPEAEIYSVVQTGEIKIRYSGIFPLWGRPERIRST